MTDTIKLDWYGDARELLEQEANGTGSACFNRQKTNVVVKSQTEARAVLDAFESINHSDIDGTVSTTIQRRHEEFLQKGIDVGWFDDGEASESIASARSIDTLQDIRDGFLEVLNIVQPDHPYVEDPYPLTHDEVDYSYCQSTSMTYARCGPRNYGRKKAFFAADSDYLKTTSTERFLVVMVHEVTHITEGSQSEGSTHNPTFWHRMALNSLALMDEWVRIQKVVGHADKEKFLEMVPEDVNDAMVDKRMRTVEEQKDEVAEVLGVER